MRGKQLEMQLEAEEVVLGLLGQAKQFGLFPKGNAKGRPSYHGNTEKGMLGTTWS